MASQGDHRTIDASPAATDDDSNAVHPVPSGPVLWPLRRPVVRSTNRPADFFRSIRFFRTPPDADLMSRPLIGSDLTKTIERKNSPGGFVGVAPRRAIRSRTGRGTKDTIHPTYMPSGVVVRDARDASIRSNDVLVSTKETNNTKKLPGRTIGGSRVVHRFSVSEGGDHADSYTVRTRQTKPGFGVSTSEPDHE